MKPKIFYLKIDVFSQNLPRNLHFVTPYAALTMRFAKNMQHDTSEVLRLPRKKTMEVSKVLCLPRRMQLIFWKRRTSIVPANDFWHIMKHVWMSRSATPATQNEATRRLEPQKVTPFAELAIGTATATSRERLRETGTLATHSGTSYYQKLSRGENPHSLLFTSRKWTGLSQNSNNKPSLRFGRQIPKWLSVPGNGSNLGSHNCWRISDSSNKNGGS